MLVNPAAASVHLSRPPPEPLGLTLTVAGCGLISQYQHTDKSPNKGWSSVNIKHVNKYLQNKVQKDP